MKRLSRLIVCVCMPVFSFWQLEAKVVTDSLTTKAMTATSVASMLRGEVAGVRVSSLDGGSQTAPVVNIRGVNSLRGNGSPLYVVDGSVIGSSASYNQDPFWQHGGNGYASSLDPLSFLSPYDVEEIVVLKSAAATSLYGSRGANGVILIKTKEETSAKTGISWDSNVRLSEPMLNGFSRPSLSHDHVVRTGASNDRTSYTVSANLRDMRYVIPGTSGLYGGLRTSFQTKANPVVWFGLNSILSAGRTTSAATTAGFGKESQTMAMRSAGGNPQAWVEDYDDDDMSYRAVTSAWLTLNLFQGFTADFRIGTDYHNSSRSFWYGNSTPFGKASNGAAAILVSSMFSYNASADFRYSRYLSDRHHLDVSAGASVVGDWNKFSNQNGTDFFLHDLRAKSINVMASKAQIHRYVCKYFTYGVYGTAKYAFDGVVGADVSVRADSTPRFDGAAMTVYPSAGIWWDVRRTFFPKNDVMSSFRIDAEYGISGFDRCLPYDLAMSYIPSMEVAPEHTSFYEVLNRLRTEEVNLSVSLGFLSDRIVLEGGVYQRRTADALGCFSFGMEGNDGLWREAPARQVRSQVSEIDGKGVELSLEAVPVMTRDWKWTMALRGSYNVGNISMMDDHDRMVRSDIGGGLTPTANVEGYPVSSFFDGNGKCLGTPTPRYLASFVTGIDWKRFSFELMMDGAAGFNLLNLSRMHIDGVSEVSSKYVEKGDFLRLSRLSFSYEVPLAKTLSVKSMKVRFTVTDPYILTGYSGWTPDVNSYAVSNSTLGMDYGSSQYSRGWILGISMKF